MSPGNLCNRLGENFIFPGPGQVEISPPPHVPRGKSLDLWELLADFLRFFTAAFFRLFAKVRFLQVHLMKTVNPCSKLPHNCFFQISRKLRDNSGLPGFSHRL